MVKNLLFIIPILLALAVVGVFFFKNKYPPKENTININMPKSKPLERYSYENLSKAKILPSQITFGKTLKEEAGFTSKIFYFTVDGKKVSGLINIPNSSGKHPVIVMYRGYAEKEGYTIGTGTRRTGEFFAQNGYITLAPDFLGYGESDPPSDSSIEERFQTYTTAVTLLNSISTLNSQFSTFIGPESSLTRRGPHGTVFSQLDPKRVGIWGHSNGGQISVSTLEITQAAYPTVLWAPVTKPFPYSVLYYTDEFDDNGKALRKVIADFETDYDIELYSLTNYLEKIKAPLQLHQGTADDAVPAKWSGEFVKKLKDLDQKITYFEYPGADHNLSGSWQEAVQKSLEFYNKELSAENE